MRVKSGKGLDMYRHRVLCSSFFLSELNQEYKKGDIFDFPRDLSSVFKNAFETEYIPDEIKSVPEETKNKINESPEPFIAGGNESSPSSPPYVITEETDASDEFPELKDRTDVQIKKVVIVGRSGRGKIKYRVLRTATGKVLNRSFLTKKKVPKFVALLERK